MKYILIAALALAMSACGMFKGLYGVDAAALDTANKQIAFGLLQVDDIRKLTQNLLVVDVITPGQAQRIKDRLDDAFGALEVARLAVEATGDPVTAENGLQAARVALALALAILNELAPNVTATLAQQWRKHHVARTIDFKGASYVGSVRVHAFG